MSDTVPPKSIQEMIPLGVLSQGPQPEGQASLASLEAPIRVSDPEDLQGRNGYSTNFIRGFPVPLPQNTGNFADDEVRLLDNSGTRLDYTNFSLVMSKSRRLAIYTACNVSGRESIRIPRGRDTWFLDGRIDLKYQIGEDLYLDNELDRGHLVRREDPVWGTDAKQANDDTFHFTNCSPQASGMNQKTWLGLEDYILKNARAHDLKVTVFTGPVMRPDDLRYRNARIPKEYWKVVAVRSEGRNSATAYMISQEGLIQDLEFVFGEYKTYQISIRRIERMTGLDFNGLADLDGFSNEEAATNREQRRNVDDWREIMI